VSAASLQSCANGAWTQVATTFAASSSSYNGLEISFDFGNNFSSTSKSIQITELDIRVTPGVATGLNSAPPTPELRPIWTELAFCQRYYYATYGNGNAPATAMLPGAANLFVGFYNGSVWKDSGLGNNFPVQMRAAPATISYWDLAGNASKASNYYYGGQINNITLNGSFAISATGFFYETATSDNEAAAQVQYTASAEL
jgi:hypothetical protein